MLADVQRWPEWTRSIDSVRLLNGKELAVGVRAAIKQPRMPLITWTVDDLTPDQGFTWTAASMGTKTVATHAIEPAPNGSRVTLALKQTGALFRLMPWVKSMSRRYIEMEAQGLKTRSEALSLV